MWPAAPRLLHPRLPCTRRAEQHTMGAAAFDVTSPDITNHGSSQRLTMLCCDSGSFIVYCSCPGLCHACAAPVVPLLHRRGTFKSCLMANLHQCPTASQELRQRQHAQSRQLHNLVPSSLAKHRQSRTILTNPPTPPTTTPPATSRDCSPTGPGPPKLSPLPV
jgi:hypothetical protein